MILFSCCRLLRSVLIFVACCDSDIRYLGKCTFCTTLIHRLQLHYIEISGIKGIKVVHIGVDAVMLHIVLKVLIL